MSVDLKFRVFSLIVMFLRFAKKVKKAAKTKPDTFFRLSRQTGKLGIFFCYNKKPLKSKDFMILRVLLIRVLHLIIRKIFKHANY